MTMPFTMELRIPFKIPDPTNLKIISKIQKY